MDHPWIPRSLLSPIPHFERAVPTQRIPQQPAFSRHSHADTHPTLFDDENPTTEERTAIDILQGIPIPTIFAWLKGLHDQDIYPDDLSDQQCLAISTLSSCPIDKLQTWLNNARLPGALNTSQNFYDNSNPSYSGVVAISLNQSPPYLADPSIHVTPRGAIPSGYDRWCFLNKDHIQTFKSLDSFKRHVREHHPQYHCIIPQELLQFREDGPKCVCGFDNPDVGHFKEHIVPGCAGKKFTRKENLIKHLEGKHKFHDGSVLAHRSKRPVDQKHFACGFCFFHCESLDALISHIDRHYRDMKHIRDWDDNKVIQSLLSQVDDYQRSFLAATPNLRVWSLTWRPTHAKNLRHRLEMCQEPVDKLVQAAIDKADKVISQHGYVNSAPATGFADEEIDTSHSVQTFQCEDKLSPLASTPQQGFLSYDPSVTAPTPQSQRPARGWDEFNNLGWPTNYEDRPSPQIASETYGSPASTICLPTDHLARPYPSQEGGESFVQHQRPTSVSSNTSASYDSKEMETQGRALDYSTRSGYSPGVSRDVADSCPTQAYVGFFPTLANQSASSSLSANREISLRQLNRAYNPHHPTVPAHYLH